VDPGSGMKKIKSGIRDVKKYDLGFGINIPDQQHCIQLYESIMGNWRYNIKGSR
jgi:hypothetical protein